MMEGSGELAQLGAEGALERRPPRNECMVVLDRGCCTAVRCDSGKGGACFASGEGVEAEAGETTAVCGGGCGLEMEEHGPVVRLGGAHGAATVDEGEQGLGDVEAVEAGGCSSCVLEGVASPAMAWCSAAPRRASSAASAPGGPAC